MKRNATFLCLLLATIAGLAQSPREEISSNIRLSANNYLAYPGPQQAELTPAPEGYEPVYLSHYGRHGSRYFIEKSDYQHTIDVLSRADSLGQLTGKGREVLDKVRRMQREASGRLGELTLLGARQHRQIARRMYERWPEVFADTAHVDARSTVVIRCILSMENALQELIRLNPRLKVRHDASEHDMYYMNQQDTTLFKEKMNPPSKQAYEQWERDHARPERVMSSLFKSRKYWKKHVDSLKLYYHLYHLAGVVQNSEIRHELSLYDLFTTDELYQLWEQENAWWYLAYGPNPLNGGLQPYTQRNLLRNIISEADSCLALKRPCSTLRYGHETMVLPLTCLLGINGYDCQVSDLGQIAREGWADYRIFPMAANLQIVFYRPKENCPNSTGDIEEDVMVKVLLNENEATLPLVSDNPPYYRWADFKAYYEKKLDDFDASR
ncbi:MAG: histidine-type phosphatase [Prevotella sp.]|nr:histidine-type phosphatase [Prevotella sp.]